MAETVIRVENLSKKYVIDHQSAGGYSTLRDKITDGAKSLGQFLTSGKKSDRPTKEEFWALKDVSFEVKQGDRLGIIGRNGAGKSTLLKILSRITEPTSGQITIHGRVASLLEVGTGFHPELTGRENIFLNGAILGMSRIEINKKFDEIVAFAEIEKFLDTPVKRYSSGMYVRLAFAVAAHLEPEILIVDEVLAVGDLAFQKKCLGKMDDVAKTGRTVLFVSHNLGVVQTLCNRGILLRQGTVIAEDNIAAVTRAYIEILEEVSSLNLFERTDRRGTTQSALVHIEISSNEAGKPTQSKLMTGHPARFVFHITNFLAGISCSFTIYDQFGQPVTYFDSAAHGMEDRITSNKETRFICELDELLLIPGRYSLNAALTCHEELQDHVEAATFFDVEPGQIRGRPILETTGYGNVLIQHRWIKPA